MQLRKIREINQSKITKITKKRITNLVITRSLENHNLSQISGNS